MYSQLDKSKENKNRSAANNISQKKHTLKQENTIANNREAISFKRVLYQRRIAAWANAQIGSGTIVYHCTDYKSAKDIIDNHIKDVPNGWGGGALGSGFYTHKTCQGSVNYVAEDRRKVVLRFKTSRDANGQSVKPSDYASKTGAQNGEDPIKDNDFLVNAEDTDEIKWHGGGALTFDGFALGPYFNNFYNNETDMKDELYVDLADMASH